MGGTQSSSTYYPISSSTEDFQGWKPDNLPWAPDTQKGFESLKYDDELFKSMYNRPPKPDEDVKGLGKAGIVLNSVFGMSAPPSKMNQRECELIGRSAQIMRDQDASIGFALSMTMARFAQTNPQCVKCWKNMGLK